MTRHGGQWPDIEAWGLDDFFRRLRSAVLDLEESARRNGLSERLADKGLVDEIGLDLLDTYTRLGRGPVEDPSAMRTETVHALLEQAREEIYDIQCWWDARVVVRGEPAGNEPVEDGPAGNEPESGEPTEGLGAIRTVAVELPDGSAATMRLDQLAAARFWGHGFVFAGVGESDELACHVAASTASRLARDLRHLQKVLRRFQPHEAHRGLLRIVPKPEERHFEQIMLDILNEHDPIAVQAPLSEDFFQKTDLRTRYAGLHRTRGARVQVTAITDERLHAAKLERIRKLEQFVILSPLSLARWVDGLVHHGREEPSLDTQQLRAFWQALPESPEDVRQLAFALRRLFRTALAQPRKDPRGPAARVPAAVRELVRAYVREDSFRSTAALRKHEREFGAYYADHNGRLRPQQHRQGHPANARPDGSGDKPDGSGDKPDGSADKPGGSAERPEAAPAPRAPDTPGPRSPRR